MNHDRIDGVENLEQRRFAHDLLQPVAIIQAVVASLRLAGPAPPRLQDDLGLIETELHVMAELCQRQLEEPRPASPIDLPGIVTRVVERMRVGYDGDLEAEIGAAPPWPLEGDGVEWERSLVNLTENACRAAGPGGKVVIAVYVEEGDLYLSVGDSGPGFGASATGRASLGLMSVSQLADHYGGHLELRRSALGGAQVTIVIRHPATRRG